MKYFTEEQKNQLAAMLINYNINDLDADEQRCANDRDFDGLKEVIKVESAISTILEYLYK